MTETKDISLTAKEAEMLLLMASKAKQELSLMNDKPSTRVVNALVKKGMAKDIMGTFWKITDAGRAKVAQIQAI